MLKVLKNLLRRRSATVKQIEGPAGGIYRPALLGGEAHLSQTLIACVNAIISRATVPEFFVYVNDEVHEEAQQLLEKPDGVLPWRDWYAVLLRMMLIEGNSYAVLTDGNAPRWQIYHPRAVQVLVDDDNRVVGYEIHTRTGRKRVAEVDTLHLGFWFPSELPGVSASPMDLLADTLGGDRALGEYLRTLLENFGTPSVIYTYRGDAVLSEEQWRALDEYFKGYFTGNRRGSVAVLRVPFDVHELGQLPEGTFRDYLFALESRICAIYRVPAQVAGAYIGYQFSTYANYDAALRNFVDNTIVPILRQTEWQLYKVLRNRFPEITDVRANVAELTPAPTAEERVRMANALANLYVLGIVAANEVREAIGLEPLEQATEAKEIEWELEEKELEACWDVLRDADFTQEHVDEKSFALYWKAWDTLNNNAYVRVLKEIRTVLGEYERAVVGYLTQRERKDYATKAAFTLPQLLEAFVQEASERVQRVATRYMRQAAERARDVLKRELRRPVQHIVEQAVTSAVQVVNERARVSFANFATEMRTLVWQLWGAATESELVQAIRAKFQEYSLVRARMAARTSVTAGITRAQRETWSNIAAENNVKIKRLWVSMRDERVRDSHREMDGKFEDDDGLFTLPSGLRGEGPGLFDDPSESINCRCTTRPRRVS